VWPDAATRVELRAAIDAMTFRAFAPYLAAYGAIMIVLHLCRSLRWRYLLAPLGVSLGNGQLLAISSVGFMAILALPARLGEFVRPSLLRKHGVSGSAGLGTVAVERIVDGLLISIFIFAAFFAIRSPHSPGWMMPTAYAALGVFALALVFLVGALTWPEKWLRFWLTISLLPRFAPRVAKVIETKALDMIRGFQVMRDRKNLSLFVAWTVVYWVANGLCTLVLARAFGLDLSVMGAFACMGLLAVGITLPNSPGLVGQFQWFTLLGLTLYLGSDANTQHTALYVKTFAFANVHYALQLLWYVLTGALALATRWVSLHDLVPGRKPIDKLA
jgi:uncharacterized protein (TIRG00374 family)